MRSLAVHRHHAHTSVIAAIVALVIVNWALSYGALSWLCGLPADNGQFVSLQLFVGFVPVASASLLVMRLKMQKGVWWQFFAANAAAIIVLSGLLWHSAPVLLAGFALGCCFSVFPVVMSQTESPRILPLTMTLFLALIVGLTLIFAKLLSL